MEIARHWRIRQQRYSLVGESCSNCNKKFFPPRVICNCCSGKCFVPYKFSGKGKIFTHTTMHEAPEAFKDFLPFTIGLIKLDEGPIITAQITDVDEIFSQGLMGLVDSYGKCVGIGTPVEMVTRLLFEDGDKGPLIYGYKFRPIMVRT